MSQVKVMSLLCTGSHLGSKQGEAMLNHDHTGLVRGNSAGVARPPGHKHLAVAARNGV